ncbi:hypothetical protein [Pelagicoccus sp. SDUM812005]|uniref:hypothetical protein n=1 Tax=Pelagicoccus sp. SDUM812005 TaxID=3041257 RepID=UPI00280FD6E5|nr:hypothetical protein [Pelagicoccus sp. SDUM812005]MDQ8181178.1 hypothetical protein [Pelagicoccus sp. SDUM812005]
MKTYRSTINAHFLACAIVIAVTLTGMLLPALAPYREALSATLGLAPKQLWILVAPLSLSLLFALSLQLKNKLCSPTQSLSEQCALGTVAHDTAYGQLKELRIIRDFVCLTQDRANARAEQISRMEQELYSARKNAERHLRKVEELEDLVTSYGRIRNELNYDLSLLRQENRNQSSRIAALERELHTLRTRDKDASIYLGGQ